MNRTATVSLVSYSPVAGDAPDRLAKTLEKMGMHITQAAARKSDLVVFPEICSYLGAPDAWVFEELDGPTVTGYGRCRPHPFGVCCNSAGHHGR